MNITADRGGPFAREAAPARNWMRAAAPGIATRIPPDESSPLGRDAPAPATTHAHHAQHHARGRISRAALINLNAVAEVFIRQRLLKRFRGV